MAATTAEPLQPVDPDAQRKGRSKTPRVKSGRRKSFELALERGSSQELLQAQPEGAKEQKGDFQVRLRISSSSMYQWSVHDAHVLLVGC